MRTASSTLVTLLLPLLALALAAGCERGDKTQEGEACLGRVGELQECRVDDEEGYERCTSVPGLEASAEWSRCLVDTCDTLNLTRKCTVENGSDGIQSCMALDDKVNVWGACGVPECTLGESRSCWGDDNGGFELNMGCRADINGVPRWAYEDCNTPLVLAFDGQAPTFSTPTAAGAFDINGADLCHTPDWPSAATPWLALDRDRSGTIDGGHELFGNGTRLAAGGRARGGFDALAELDHDHDGRITPNDPAWIDLLLWSDHDGDRRSTHWELQPLDALGLVAIELDNHLAPACDRRGNCAGERAGFTFRRGDKLLRGDVIDVYLACE